MVGKTREQAGAVHEGTGQYPYLVAGREGWHDVEPDKPLFILTRLERVHHAFRHHRRIVAVADETRYPEGRLNRSPALGRDIDCNEHIARKQLLGGEVHFAGMTAAFQI